MPTGRPEHTAAAPPRSRIANRYGSASLILGGSGAAIALLIVIAASFLINEARVDAVSRWQTSLLQFARVLAGHADQSFRAADLVLTSAREDLQPFNVWTSTAVRNLDGRAGLLTSLQEHVAGAGHLEAITIFDISGQAVVSSRAKPWPDEIQNRPDVKAALASNFDVPFIGDAVINQLTGKWSVSLTRPIFGASGNVIGAMSVALRDHFFTDFYQNLELEGTVTLVRQDGVVLARYPNSLNSVGRSVADSTAYKRFMRDGPGAVEVTEPRILANDAVSTRIVAVNGAPSYPVLIFATTLDDVYLARWRSTVQIIAVGAGAGCALVLGFTYVVLQLQSAQRRLAEELGAGIEAAEAAARAKSDFVAIMSHEIRNPLNIVLGMTELLRMSRLTPEQKRYVDAIRATSTSLVALLHDVMGLSRLEAGRTEVKREPVLIEHLLDRSVKQGEILAKGKRLTVRAETSPDLPDAVMGDPDRLQQVLLNLVGNAVKFTPAGSITLRALRVEGLEGEPLLRLEVEDTGPGIAPDLRERLFQPYEQGGNDPTLRAAGVGLGLSICRTIAEMLHGRLGVADRDGPGSLFFMEIPLEAANPASMETGQAKTASPIATSEPDALPRSLRVLVAEDEPLNRSIVEMLLKRLGHRPVLVENGALALEKAQLLEPFDIMLLDIQMPVMDGLTTARLIRQLPDGKGRARLVAMTAQVGTLERERASGAGFDDVLAKPFSSADVQAALAAARHSALHEGTPA